MSSLLSVIHGLLSKTFLMSNLLIFLIKDSSMALLREKGKGIQVGSCCCFRQELLYTLHFNFLFQRDEFGDILDKC